MRALLVLLLIAILGGSYWWFASDKGVTAPSGTEQVSAYLSQFNPEALSLERLVADQTNNKKIILQGLKIDQIWGEINWRNAYKTLAARPTNIDTLSIQGARFTLYHPAVGLLNFDIGAQIRFENGDNFTLNGKLTSAQKQLSLDLALSGQGTWREGETPTGTFDLQFEQTNFNVINFQLNRLSGAATLAIGNDGLRFTPTLQAGGANICGLPWQNVRIAGEDMTLTAQSLGQGTPKPLELSIAPKAEKINIAAATLGMFLEYIERYGAELQKHQQARTYSALDDIQIHVQAPQGGLWDALLQPAPLPQIDILIQKDGLKTHIAETILLPH